MKNKSADRRRLRVHHAVRIEGLHHRPADDAGVHGRSRSACRSSRATPPTSRTAPSPSSIAPARSSRRSQAAADEWNAGARGRRRADRAALPAVGRRRSRTGDDAGARGALGPRQARRDLRLRRDPARRARSRQRTRDLSYYSNHPGYRDAAGVDREHRQPRDRQPALPRRRDRSRAREPADPARRDGASSACSSATRPAAIKAAAPVDKVRTIAHPGRDDDDPALLGDVGARRSC